MGAAHKMVSVGTWMMQFMIIIMGWSDAPIHFSEALNHEGACVIHSDQSLFSPMA